MPQSKKPNPASRTPKTEHRKPNTAIIGFGANIAPEKNIQKAKELLSKKYPIEAESTFVETIPIGISEQPNFLNGAVKIKTLADCHQLKISLKEIERLLGRDEKTLKFGPRTIDLDILVWNEEIISQDYYTRDFVKKFVLELAGLTN